MRMDQAQAIKDILETVQFLRDHAVSKEDAAVFATKEDLKLFATKEDLRNMEDRLSQQFATKEDLQSFATKEDLRQMKDDIMAALDALVVLHKKLEMEVAAMHVNYQRVTGQLERLARHVQFDLSATV